MDNYFIIVLCLVIGTLSAQGDSYRTDFIPSSVPLTGAVRQSPAHVIQQQQQGCVWSTVENNNSNGNKNGSTTIYPPFLQQRPSFALDCHVRTLNDDFWSNYTFTRDQLESTTRLNVKCNDKLFFESDLEQNQRYFSLRNLKEVSFQSCKIRKITARIFSNWGSLRSLAISSLNGEWSSTVKGQMEIESGAFEGLSSITNLQLSQNNIWAFQDRNVFCPLRTSLNKFNISRNRLSDLDELGFGTCMMTRVQTLDISHNSLRRIHAITKLPNLSILLLQHNMIYEIDENAFQNLPQLRKIDLSSNKLVALAPTLFKSNPELRELTISNNNLGVLSPVVFNSLTRLLHLDLSNNNLGFINPLTFQSLKTLKTLLLNSNKVTLIDSRLFSQLSSLRTLTLDSNEINEIDHDSLKNCPLEDIGLSNNKLKTLPYLPPSLVTADLGENLLENITFSGPMHHLYGLRIVGNMISELDPQLCQNNMRNLRVLNLSKNRIKSIPMTCPNLRALRLDENLLEELPNTLGKQFENLLWLNVSTNRLQWAFYKLLPPSVEWLDLSYNNLSVFASTVDTENDTIPSSLRVVDLSFNKLEQLDFIIPPTLEILRVNNNLLRNVSPYTFSRSTNLRRVDLKSNKLESLPLTALRIPPVHSSKPLPEFYLAGNNFSCDCSMEWLTRVNQLAVLRQHPKIADIDAVACRPPRSPNHLVPVLDVRPREFLCPYTEHCNAECHCCDYEYCDCAYKCDTANGCLCLRDQSWSSIILVCQSNLTQIPSNIPIDVTELYLDGNDLPVLNDHIFLARRNLRSLFLNGSHVQTIKNKTFSSLKSLEYLQLSSNEIEEIAGFEFEQLHNIIEIHLNDNRIRFIAKDSFTRNPLLRVLNLAGNLLSNFHVWEQLGGINLNSISLADNLWTCDCEFVVPFRTWLAAKTNVVRDFTQIKCYSPATVGSNGTDHFYMQKDQLEPQLIVNMCDDNKELNFNFNPNLNNDNMPALLDDSDLLNSNHISAEKVASPSNDMNMLMGAVNDGNGNNFNNNPYRNNYPSINDIPSAEENKSELWTIFTSVLITLIIVLFVIAFLVFRKSLLPFWLYSWLPLGFCGGSAAAADDEAGESSISSLFSCCCVGSGGGKKSRSKRGMDDSEKLFDAYFLYSQKDAELMEKFTLQLEGGGGPYRLCLHYRDLCLLNEEMVDTAAKASKRVVLVVSNNFLNGEFRSCLHSVIQQHSKKIVIIKVPPVSDQSVSSICNISSDSPVTTKLEWGDKNFWSKLKLILPTPTISLSVNSTGTISSTDSSGNFNMTPNYHLHHNNMMNYSNGVSLHEYAYNTINNHRNILPCNGNTSPAWQQQQHSQIIPIPGYPLTAINATTPLMVQNTFHQPTYPHTNFHQPNIPQPTFHQPFNESFRRHLQQNKTNVNNVAVPAPHQHHHHHHLSNCSNSSQGHPPHHHHRHQGSHCSSSHSSSTSNNNPSLHPYQPLDANYSSSSSNEELLDHVYSTLDSPPIMSGLASCGSNNNNGCESSIELDSKQMNVREQDHQLNAENSSSPLQNRLNNNKNNCPVVNNTSGTQPNSPSCNNGTNNPTNNGTMYFV